MTGQEAITFQVLPVSELPKASIRRRWLAILKIYNCVLPSLTIFFVLMKAELENLAWSPSLGLISFIGVIALMIAMNLRNDYNDHVSGLDRIFEDSSERSIQKGWITAHLAKKLSNAFVLIGAVAGAIAVWKSPLSLIAIAVVVAVVVGGTSLHKIGLQYRMWTEVSAFLLLGPLLSIGYALAIRISPDPEIIFIGVLTGWYAVFQLHLKNFARLMVSHQLKLANSVTLLGFERAKFLLWIWWSFFYVLLLVFHICFSPTVWTFGFLLVGSGLSLVFFRQLWSIRSPVGSNLRSGILNLRRLGYVFIAFWILENVGYLLVREFGAN